MARKSHYGTAHQRARAELLVGDPLCVHCSTNVATVADHQPPIALHAHEDGSGCCTYVPSCAECSQRQAGAVSKMLAAGAAIEVIFDEPDPSPSPLDPVWDALPWLDELRDVPSDATWPRWMSSPHPAAVGSYLADFEAFALDRSDFVPFWWQRLVAARLLEHDADGRLVWGTWLLTVARQVGKSRLLVELLIWVARHVDRFFQATDVLLTARNLGVTETLMAPELHWARKTEGWGAVLSKGSQSMTWDDRHSLHLRATSSVYGLTIGVAAVDEAWDVQASTIAEGVRPTLLAAEGQLGLISTAHRKATSLMLNERQRGFDQLDDPRNRLLIEWSTPHDLDLDDVEGWRMASPRWTAYREELIRDALDAARSGEVLDPDEPDPIAGFEAQYLNRWPRRQTRRGAGEALLETGVWARALKTTEPPSFQRVLAVQDNYGRGLAVVVAGVTVEERIGVTAEVFEDDRLGWERVRELAPGCSTVLVGASMHAAGRSAAFGRFELVGRRELAAGLAILRATSTQGQIVHDGSPELAEQIIACRVRPGSSGLVIASKGRHDAVEATAWAVTKLAEARTASTAIY